MKKSTINQQMIFSKREMTYKRSLIIITLTIKPGHILNKIYNAR